MYRSDGMMNWVQKKAFARHHKHEVINKKNIEEETERAESAEESLLAKIAELESGSTSFDWGWKSITDKPDIDPETGLYKPGAYLFGQGRKPDIFLPVITPDNYNNLGQLEILFDLGFFTQTTDCSNVLITFHVL